MYPSHHDLLIAQTGEHVEVWLAAQSSSLASSTTFPSTTKHLPPAQRRVPQCWSFFHILNFESSTPFQILSFILLCPRCLFGWLGGEAAQNIPRLSLYMKHRSHRVCLPEDIHQSGRTCTRVPATKPVRPPKKQTTYAARSGPNYQRVLHQSFPSIS
ncbi:hypothetical protein J3458_022454 [Metarhizium acridum]|uniref:uncharacterized protein n=1 Tax=Metarhizium acridum TaxID=92637 RepID=UPI001C6B912A|nr:hypothetical protein J3458_022454 [Metarhizium acridum]